MSPIVREAIRDIEFYGSTTGAVPMRYALAALRKVADAYENALIEIEHLREGG